MHTFVGALDMLVPHFAQFVAIRSRRPRAGATVQTSKHNNNDSPTPRRGPAMKKIAPYIIVFLAALLVMNLFDFSHDLSLHFDGDDIDGPAGALAALLAGGLGLIIGAVVLVVVGVVLAVVFASLGVMAVIGIALAVVLGLLALSPLLLPLLIPVLIIWYITSRNRKERERQQALRAEPV
jgi:hypothetical protein